MFCRYNSYLGIGSNFNAHSSAIDDLAKIHFMPTSIANKYKIIIVNPLKILFDCIIDDLKNHPIIHVINVNMAPNTLRPASVAELFIPSFLLLRNFSKYDKLLFIIERKYYPSANGCESYAEIVLSFFIVAKIQIIFYISCILL